MSRGALEFGGFCEHGYETSDLLKALSFYTCWATFGVWKGSNFAEILIQCTYGQLHLYMPGSAVEIQTPTQYDRPAVCVIAQQYFSATVV